MEILLAVLLSVVAADAPQTRASTALSSERQQEPSHRIPLAVIDVARVFREAQPFNEKIKRIKLGIEDFDRNVRAKWAEFNDQLPPELEEEEKARKAALFDAELRTKKNTLLADEALVYADTYQAMEHAVQRICGERGIGIVIRATTDPMDPKDRGSVLQAVNRPVVYKDVPDLTADVIAALNKEDASTALTQEHERTSSHRVPMAVLDVAKVFKEARDFNQKMQSMKLEISAFDSNFKDRRSGPGDSSTPDLKSYVVVKKETILSEEAQAYAETYRAIENAVQRICSERDIGVVIRATTEPMDPKDRTSVLQSVNRPVVYMAVPDLTADVIAALNKSSQ